jgi:hypothetical protein
MPLEAHWRRLNRALDHINTLDSSIQGWLDSDAYRIVKEHDAESRRTAYVAHIGPTPSDWPDLVGEAVHSLRSALDRLAFALNAKGYADAHNGAEIPAERESDSAFPIFGLVNQRGQPMDGERAFRSSTSHRDMPSGAVAVIENLQPYKRGQDFRLDPLWAIHELSRVDKHRIDLGVTAAPPATHVRGKFPAVDAMALGAGGPVHNGKELSYWVTSKGAEEPDVDFKFARGVAFGEATPLRDQPVVPTLRGIRDYLRFRVAFPLDRFL